jgi:Beta-lactamase superfamily domain
MFSVTYLGQQGWLIGGAQARILVDPLLTDEYSPGFEAKIHPPRVFDFRKFPSIDAVVLSHEHADHLNVPSLALLDRRIPVILPARSALPLREVIAQLGFRVVLAHVGSKFSVGDLTIRVYGGEFARDAELESEGTTLQVLISDRSGDGSFFTYVDSWPTDETIDHLTRSVGRLGMFCHANNTMDWSVLEGGVAAGWPNGTLDYAAEVIAAEATWWRDRLAPELTVVCGPGLAFVGEDAWMNQILCCDSQRVSDALGVLAPGRAFRSPIPGETFRFVAGRARRTAKRSTFVRALDRARWPSLLVRKRRALIEDFSPACGHEAFDPDAWSGLERELDRLAAYLYRRSLFRTLNALDGRALHRQPAFALVLRCADDLAYVLEYQPNASRFSLVSCRAPMETYVAGLECWASDLWRVLDGQLLPQRLLGHMRTWNHLPQPMSVLQALWGFFDFMNRPAAATTYYRQVVERERDRPAQIARGTARPLRAAPAISR